MLGDGAKDANAQTRGMLILEGSAPQPQAHATGVITFKISHSLDVPTLTFLDEGLANKQLSSSFEKCT